MALNRTTGEIIGDLGHNYRVVPTAKWAESPLFDMAAQAASDAFARAGAILPVRVSTDDCLVQEYPDKDMLAFLFVRRIAGEERYYPHVYTLQPPLVSALVNAGLWERITVQ